MREKNTSSAAPEASEPYASDGSENTEFDLNAWPFYWLTRTNDRYLESLERALQSVELDIPRWRVLMLLGSTDAKSVSYLATESSIKLSTMTRIVQRMQSEGLVTTRPRASDNRVTEVLLTGNGRRARPLVWQQANRIYTKAFESISPEDIAHLNATLKKIFMNFKSDS